MIDLTFSSKVFVTETDFAKFTISSFLSEVGGSMGLWLGLGVVQVLELAANWVLLRINKYMSAFRQN